MSVIAAGLVFLCTPTLVADGDGPVWCAEGPRLRIAGIAARDIAPAELIVSDYSCSSQLVQ